MNNLVTIGIIFIASLLLGFIKYGSIADKYKNSSWQLKLIEIWNDFWNFFIAGLIGYYFVSIRAPLILEGAEFTVSDLILFIIFALGIFGHLCVMSKNITEGVQAILKGILNR